MQRLKQIATGEEIIDTPAEEEAASVEEIAETADTPETTEAKDAETPEA
jgi:hypothetical protein